MEEGDRRGKSEGDVTESKVLRSVALLSLKAGERS